MRAQQIRSLKCLARASAVILAAVLFQQSASAREIPRLVELPQHFEGWGSARADDASLAEAAKGLSAASLPHAADFCLGASGLAQEISAGLPLYAITYCPVGFAALRGAPPSGALIRLPSLDRPIPTNPAIPSITQTMCAPALRNR